MDKLRLFLFNLLEKNVGVFGKLGINTKTPGALKIYNFFSSTLREEVWQTTIDHFVKDQNIPKINFIKADVEGMERNLLVGAEQSIKRFKPKITIFIYHRVEDPSVIEKMIKNFVPEYNMVQTSEKLYAWFN